MEQKRIALQEVVITYELLQRTARPANPLAEKTALEAIAATTPDGRDAILHALCRVGLELCKAGSCGINLLEGVGENRVFRWAVIEGVFAPHQGGTGPADHSPCGYVYERKSAQLLCRSARYFEWMQAVDIPVHESLIVPLHLNKDDIIGTIWAVSHDDAHRFDREDLRILTLLSSHAIAALKVHESMYQA